MKNINYPAEDNSNTKAAHFNTESITIMLR